MDESAFAKQKLFATFLEKVAQKSAFHETFTLKMTEILVID